jgi:hypothetical protein
MKTRILQPVLLVVLLGASGLASAAETPRLTETPATSSQINVTVSPVQLAWQRVGAPEMRMQS